MVQRPASILVTGGNSGIGIEVVRALLEEWAESRCVVADIATEAAEGLRGRFGDRVRAVKVDVTDIEDVRRAVDVAVTEFGSVEGLVNCAGIQRNHPSLELAPEVWHQVLACHLDGTFFASQAAARRMIEAGHGGAIVNVSSVARRFGWPRRLPYSVAKAGIDAMTRTLAVEWAEHGIRVNAVAPGYIETPMVVEAIRQGHVDARMRDEHAMGRFGQPSEVASVVLFLLSDASSFMTGTVVDVDGGFSAKKIPS